MADEDEDLDIQIDALDGENTDAPAVAETPVVEAKKEISADDGIAELKAAREARIEAEREAKEARKAQKEAEDRYAEGQRAVQSRQAQEIDGHIGQLTSARDAVNSDVKLLRHSYAEAARDGNYDKMADIQVHLAEKAAQFAQFNQAITALSERKRQPAPEPQRQPEAKQTSALSSKSQAWIDAHTDVIKDPKMFNKMVAGHHDAIANDIEIDSPEYFEHVERRMGLKKDEPTPAAAPRKVQTAAPVSRSAPSQGGKVTVRLTAAERQIARDINMTDAEYAASKAKLERQGRITH